MFIFPKKPKDLEKKRLLFVLKQRELTWSNDLYSSEYSSGLLNSVRFVQHMIDKHFNNYTPELSQVIDHNSIDREVARFKPDICIIEALWVTPEKIDELTRLHPNVNWVIRVHSELPFISNEGIAMDWLNRYVANSKVRVAANSERMRDELTQLLRHPAIFLPNCYEFLD